jgi:hypothetical protein
MRRNQHGMHKEECLFQQVHLVGRRLWTVVTEAIAQGDQMRATEEKGRLEDEQRAVRGASLKREKSGDLMRSRKMLSEADTDTDTHMCMKVLTPVPQLHRRMKEESWAWPGVHFQHGPSSDKMDWHYRYADARPWNTSTEVEIYEMKGRIMSRRRLGTADTSGSTQSAASASTLSASANLTKVDGTLPSGAPESVAAGIDGPQQSTAALEAMSTRLESRLAALQERVSKLESRSGGGKGVFLLVFLLVVFQVRRGVVGIAGMECSPSHCRCTFSLWIAGSRPSQTLGLYLVVGNESSICMCGV